MSILSEFHWLRPGWLLLLPLGAWLIWRHWQHRLHRSNWAQVCDAHLLDYLLVGPTRATSRLPLAALLLGWSVAIVAAAGPTWEKQPQPTYRAQLGRVLVLDLSRSMDSTDIAPSRLQRARFKLDDLIDAGRGQYQGLVVFAGDAFVVAPLTDDAATLKNLLPNLATDTPPVQGSRTDLALLQAAELLQNFGLSEGHIILIADGVTPDSADIAAKVAARGYRVSVLAVGSARGTPIALDEGGLLKDAQGNIVFAGVNFAELQRVAARGNGQYSVLQADDQDIQRLSRADSVARPTRIGRGAAEHPSGNVTDQWRERGVWLLPPLLLLASLGFRRGWLLVMLVVVPLVPGAAWAFEWPDLWWRADQQAARALQRQDFAGLADSQLPQWRGSGHYRQKNYRQAAAAFAEQTDARAWYNRANALAHSGELHQAIDAYTQALAQQPDFADATFNRELVKSLLQQQPQTPSSAPPRQSDESGESGESNAEQNTPDSARAESTAPQPDPQSAAATSESAPPAAAQNQPEPQSAAAPSATETEQRQTPESHPPQARDATADPEQLSAAQPPPTPVPLDEQQQAVQQWLRQIPDDPGGLLRRKFAQQYQQRERQVPTQLW